jgi:hypothetical protein
MTSTTRCKVAGFILLILATTLTPLANARASTPRLLALVRLYSSDGLRVKLASDPAKISDLIDAGFGSAKTVGFVWDQSVPGSAPLIHYRNEATDTDLYRADTAPVATGLPHGAPAGFSMEGNVGFAYVTDAPGSIGLQSIGIPSSHTFDYASDPAEVASRQAQGGRRFATVAFLLSRADIPYFERFEPVSNPRRNQPNRPRGHMIVIPGGFWQNSGAAGLASPGLQASVERYRALGWQVTSVSYRSTRVNRFLGRKPIPASEEHSIDDVVWFYDEIRSQTLLPICVSGGSSGGHLALMLAHRRPEVVCVIGTGTPTDLMAWREYSGGFAAAIFDDDPTTFERLSPVTHVAEMRARILLGSSAHDDIVPAAQMDYFIEAVDALPEDLGPETLDTIVLESPAPCLPDDPSFTHVPCVYSEDLDLFLANEAMLINEVASDFNPSWLRAAALRSPRGKTRAR